MNLIVGLCIGIVIMVVVSLVLDRPHIHKWGEWEDGRVIRYFYPDVSADVPYTQKLVQHRVCTKCKMRQTRKVKV